MGDGLFGQQPAGGGPHPVAGVALVAQGGGLVHELDIRPDARVPAFELVDDDVGDLGLLAIVDAPPVDALPVGIVGAHDQLDHAICPPGPGRGRSSNA